MLVDILAGVESIPSRECEAGTLDNRSLQKKFLQGGKKCRSLLKEKRPVFIGRNRIFFTKIHQNGKSCQSYRRFQIPISRMVKWGV